MLLIIDIGNTNITYAICEGEKIKHKFRVSTKPAKTSDEYGHIMMDLMNFNKVEKTNIDKVTISSVVPNVMHSIRNSVYKYLDIEPLIITPFVEHGLIINAENPAEVGADRIADAVAAFKYYGGPVLIADFGTATTYDVVNEKGEFVVAVTAPGIKISAKSLWTETAKLPDIQIESPGSILATNTVTSMQAGLIYGTVGEFEYIVKRIEKELDTKLKVIATGGLARVIEKETDIIDVYDQDLTLNGIRLITEMTSNKNRS